LEVKGRIINKSTREVNSYQKITLEDQVPMEVRVQVANRNKEMWLYQWLLGKKSTS
jgi:hypothetical protein